MLYEMLTGRLPFEGDSAVAIALKHLSEQPRADLAVAAGRASGARGGGHGGAREGPGAPLAVGGGPGGGPRGRADSDRGRVERRTGHRRLLRDSDARGPARWSSDPEPERERRWPWYAIGALALALVAVLAYLILSGVLATDKKPVPRVTGKQLVEARAVMERAGFEVQTERVQSAQPFDQVLDQDPNAGEEADAGSTVTLEVSGGPGRGAGAGGGTADRGTGHKRAAEGGPQGDQRSGVLRQGEEGVRDPHRARRRVPRSPRARGCGCWSARGRSR